MAVLLPYLCRRLALARARDRPQCLYRRRCCRLDRASYVLRASHALHRCSPPLHSRRC